MKQASNMYQLPAAELAHLASQPTQGWQATTGGQMV